MVTDVDPTSIDIKTVKTDPYRVLELINRLQKEKEESARKCLDLMVRLTEMQDASSKNDVRLSSALAELENRDKQFQNDTVRAARHAAEAPLRAIWDLIAVDEPYTDGAAVLGRLATLLEASETDKQSLAWKLMAERYGSAVSWRRHTETELSRLKGNCSHYESELAKSNNNVEYACRLLQYWPSFNIVAAAEKAQLDIARLNWLTNKSVSRDDIDDAIVAEAEAGNVVQVCGPPDTQLPTEGQIPVVQRIIELVKARSESKIEPGVLPIVSCTALRCIVRHRQPTVPQTLPAVFLRIGVDNITLKAHNITIPEAEYPNAWRIHVSGRETLIYPQKMEFLRNSDGTIQTAILDMSDFAHELSPTDLVNCHLAGVQNGLPVALMSYKAAVFGQSEDGDITEFHFGREALQAAI